MKILYIGRNIGDESNGANQVMRRNRNTLLGITCDKRDFKEFYLPPVSIKNVVLSILSDNGYGITPRDKKEINTVANSFKPDVIFIDSSSYGSICKMLNRNGFKTIVFAHNIDTALCRQEITSRSPLIAYPKYWITKRNERRSAEYSDVLICLTQRDSDGFKHEFGRSADCILPISFPRKNFDLCHKLNTVNKKTFLFVGSDFFPNVEGIKWFILNVAPKVDAEFRIVGSCCENPSIQKMAIPSNVKLVGYADNLESEYLAASGVIAPIFKGSGMKTKTIEALSFGKSIFGTDEAFAGIECDYSKIGALCNSADEFIYQLNKYNSLSVNKYSQQLFENKFSNNSFKTNLNSLLLSTIK